MLDVPFAIEISKFSFNLKSETLKYLRAGHIRSRREKEGGGGEKGQKKKEETSERGQDET